MSRSRLFTLVLASVLACGALLPAAGAEGGGPVQGTSDESEPECVNLDLHPVAERLGFFVSVWGAVGFVVSSRAPGTDVGLTFGVIVVPDRCGVSLPAPASPMGPLASGPFASEEMLGLP